MEAEVRFQSALVKCEETFKRSLDNLTEKHKMPLAPRASEPYSRGVMIANQLIAGLEAQDYSQIWMLENAESKFSRDVFTLLTGIKLPKTQRDSRIKLREMSTPESVEKYEFEQAKRFGEQAALRLREQRISHQGAEMNGQQFLDAVIADGFRQLTEETKKGRKEVRLGKLGTFFILKSWESRAYARYALLLIAKGEHDGHHNHAGRRPSEALQGSDLGHSFC